MKRVLLTFIALAAVSAQSVFAQGAAGIDAASSELATYVDPIANLILVIGAIVGLLGGIRVYIKWNSGDQDVQKAIMGWFGSAVFILAIGVAVRTFFGV